jgi:hypothetical protein
MYKNSIYSFPINALPKNIFEQWQQLILKQSDHIADEARWMNFVALNFKKTIKVTVLLDENSELLAACYWTISPRILGKKTIVVGPFGGLGGIVGEGKSQNSLIRSMLEIAEKDELAIVIRSRVSQNNQEFSSKKEISCYEKVISNVMLMEGLSGNLRYKIRKSYKQDITVGDVFQLSDLSEFSDFFFRAFRELGSPFFGKKYLENLLKVYKNDICFLQLRSPNSKLIGLAVLIRIANTLHVLHVNTNKYGRNLGAGYRLYFEIMLKAEKDLLNKVNFGRSIEDSNQASFKKMWAMNEIPMEFLKVGGAPSTFNYTNAKKLYRLFIWAWRYTPVWIVKLMGPKASKLIM